MNREYYLPTEILPLVLASGKAKSAFYRAVKRGYIAKVSHEGKEVYEKNSVDQFLKGDFDSINERKRKPRTAETNHGRTSSFLPSTTIDIVRWEDTAALYMMETEELPSFESAIVPPVIQSWISKNRHSYWAQYDAHNRKTVQAVLGILPLREEIITHLLHKELAPKDIPADAVLPYEPGGHYSCYITSVTSVSEHQTSVVQLMQRVLSYWSKHDIHIDRVYIEVPELSLEASLKEYTQNASSFILTNEYFFSPLYGVDDFHGDNVYWVLRLDRRNGNAFVRYYQHTLIQHKKEKDTMLATLSPGTLPIETVEQIKTKPRDFTKMVSGGHLRHLGPDGEIMPNVKFRVAKSIEDVREIIRINNSLFGKSQNVSDDTLVDHRMTWLAQNPEVLHVLEVHGRIVGFVSLLPLPEDIMDGVLRSQITMSRISADQLLKYVPNRPFDVFVWTLAVDPLIKAQEKSHYGFFLVLGIWNFINDLGKRGIEIHSVYARSDEVDGINTSFSLGFEPIPPPPGVRKLVFKLDVPKSDKAFLTDYKNALLAYQTSHQGQ